MMINLLTSKTKIKDSASDKFKIRNHKKWLIQKVEIFEKLILQA